MASRAINPYYNDPNIEAIASNIRKAFIDPNPGQTAVYRQHGRLYGLQADKLEREAAKRAELAAIYGRPGQNGVLTLDQHASAVAAAIEAGVDPKVIAGHYLYLSANGGAPAPVVARAHSGTGQLIGENQGVTLEDREAVAARADAARAQRSQIAAGPGYAAVAQRERAHKDQMDFQEKTRWDKPVEVNQGAAVYPHPDDKRMPGVAPGTIPAPKPPTADRYVVVPNGDGTYRYEPVQSGLPAPTPSSERTPLVDAFDPNSPTGVSRQPDRPNMPRPGPKEAAPMDVNAGEVSDLINYALKDAGVVDDQWRPDSQFTEQFGDKLPAARSAAAATYQKTRDAEAGKRAFWEALGVQPGSKWVSNGPIARGFGHKSRFDPPKSAVGTAVTGGGSPPAAQSSKPAAAGAVPPPEQRVPGRTYPTPKGPMTWTGTGWVAPSNVK